MKKTLGVISLAVLLSVQILTPVTYAVWDDDFVSETYVEESASEEIVEATDDTDEVSDEVSEEDDASEEVTEEDSSDEDSQVEDTLDWDEDSEDTEESDALEEVSDPEWEEVSAWSSEESISEESPVLSEEDEAFIAKLSKQWSVAKIAEELWINWYTDSSEIAVLAWIEWDYYGTKEQNNIIREYLISHALELLKKNVPSEDVVEEVTVEEAVSSEVELTWLNEKEISWSKYYNGVVVNVLAPVKSFPEGTTLSITPIKKKNDLKEIKEQLVESQEVTEESTVVAFDISFLYSWEEVQPVTGQTVQVTFNYENHEWLTNAEQDEEKELKVYHLNDKDEDGNKVEDISEVKVEAVETVKNEEWEIVVEAENFSIYTIVTQVAEEGPEATEDQLANFEYGEISIARPADLDASEYPIEWFTIMDRNLWASEIWVWADASTGSYGYYYQWWNNYWFSPYKNITTSSGPINVSNNEYSWSTFITVWSEESWMNPVNTNLWQGKSKWPCPAWWHVPTASEWSNLLIYYAKYYENENGWEVDLWWRDPDYSRFVDVWPIISFINDFNIPFAWMLNYDSSFNGSQEFWTLRSSTMLHDYPEYVYSFMAAALVGSEYGTMPSATLDDNNGVGIPVRCFKDSYTPESDQITMSFDFKGWRWSTAAIKVQRNTTWVIPSEPQRANSTFTGWYVSGADTKYDFTENITAPVELYAKYDCDEWFEPNEDWTACVQYNTVTFNVAANGWTTWTAESVKVISWEILDLDDYTGTKAGWDFVWWNTVSTETWAMENPGVVWSMDLYAIFSKTVTITFDVNGNGWTSGDVICTMYNTWTSCSISSPNITVPRDDFIVIGWSTDNDRHQNDWTWGESKSISATGTYYAQTKTTPSPYTASFSAWNWVAAIWSTSLQCTPDIKYNGENVDTDCVIEGWYPSITPLAWYENGKWTNEKVPWAQLILTDDASFIATATPIVYTISYENAAGLTSGFTWTYTVEDTFILQQPSKTWWNFIAWHSGSLEWENISSISLWTKGNITLYAEWDWKTFIGNFVANGATISKTSAQCKVTEGETCTILSVNLPTITRENFTIKWWSTNSGAENAEITVGQNIVLSETNNWTAYYAITEKPVVVKFDGNGNGWPYVDKTCVIRNTANDCPITAPDMIVPTWFTKIWWNTSATTHTPEWDWGEMSFTTGATYYAQTINVSPLTATFNWNWNTIDNQKQQVVRQCDRYNNETKCTIENVPVIDQNIYTTTILWYSLNAATWSAIAQFGTVTLDATTIAWWTTDIEINKNEVLYAQTYSPAVTRTVTYKKWENDSFGIINFASFTDSCTIAAIYNGNNSVPQATWCQLIAPEVQSSNGYEWYWEWPMTKGDQYTVYSDRTISAYSTGEHYSISFYLDGWDWPTGVTQQDSYQEWDTVVINEPVWTGYTFIGWTTWSNTVPVKNISIQPTDKWSKLFVAHWQQDEYRIIYSDTVQWTTNLVSTYSYENGATLVAPNKSPMGYTFKWWIGENGDTPELSVTIPAWVVWDKYFTAVWEAESYTVTGHLNWWNIGGETTYVFTYDIESGNIALGTPTRENSTFIGWTGSNGSSPDLNVVISQWSHWDKEYYAVYTCNEWYEANGNTCVLKPYSVTYVLDEWKHTTVNPQETVTRDEASYKINIKNPIKTGYNFLWWTTNIQNVTCKEGTTERANCRAESANDLTIEFADWQAVTLTAKWAHVPIEVSKQDLIGTTPTGTATVTEYGYDSRIDLAAEAMTWYRTLWWSEGTDWVVKYNDNTKEYVRDLTIVYDNPTAVSWGTWRISLYSVRELINYTIKYVLNEWVQTNPTTYNVTQANIVLTDAVKTWYVFKWWYDADENKITTITPEVVAELTSPYKLTLTARWETSKNTPYKVYHERQWIDGEYYKTNTERTDVDELTWETDKSVTPARRTNYVWFIMPVDQKTDTIKADGSTEIIYQYEREKHTYKYNTVVWATTKWKRSLDADYTTNATTTQMFFDTPIILSWKADTWYSWSWWDITSWGETTRIVAPTYEFNMPLVNVEVTPVVYHIPYTLKFDVNGWTGDSWDLADVYPIYYDSWITYPVVTRMWYTFLGWYDDATNTRYGSWTEDGNLKMPNSDLTLTAHWQANDFTLNVNHYKMNLSGEYSTTPNKIVQIETKIDADLTGTNNPGILPETYKGFTLSGDVVETIHINPDGSSVINYYYSRDKHNVRINENEGVTLSGTMSGEYYYETSVAVEALAKTGYTWSWWNVTSGGETVFTDLTGVEFVLSTWDVELTPFVTVNEYHLTVQDGSTIIFSWDVLYKTDISTYLGSLSKNGYTFNGWTNRPANDLMSANDLVIEAKWTKISPSGWGGGGGSSSSSDTNKDKTPVTTWAQEQEHGSAELTGEVKKVDEPKEEKEEVKSEVKPIENMQFEEIKDVTADQLNKVDRTKLTKEQNEILDAYQWAYEHNVTTMVTLRDANPEWVVTRGHLAKMVVNYATNVLGQKIPEKIPSECRWNDYRSDWESQEIKDYAVKACALWLMWLNMKKFQPKVWVSRAQFGTIMSRLLWWKKYAGWTPYYRNHLNALKKNGIMTQIGNPEGRTELRQWVWLMLMRAGEEK